MSKAGWIRTVVLVALFGGIEALCRTGVISPKLVIAPSAMVLSMVNLITAGALNDDIAQTLSSVGIAMGLSITGGFALGCVLYWLPPLRRAFDPFLAAYYSLPHFAFYPLLIVIFGLGAAPLIVLATLFAMVAMIMATLTGLDRIPRVLIKTARMQRLSLPSEIWHIRLPAAAPHLFSGLKLAVTYSFIGVIAGEFILSTSGLGHQIAFSYDNFDNRTMYGVILFVLCIATVFNLLVFAYERRLARQRGP
ncbi:MAG TPA: ABC transporter permease [Reyranella sp.]|nr:ABC transporter permease [Reyranella sp.]